MAEQTTDDNENQSASMHEIQKDAFRSLFSVESKGNAVSWKSYVEKKDFITFAKLNVTENLYFAADLLVHGKIESGDMFDNSVVFIACSTHDHNDHLLLHFVDFSYVQGK
jgi:hypothetical protein